jgi:hypothetical protein
LLLLAVTGKIYFCFTVDVMLAHELTISHCMCAAFCERAVPDVPPKKYPLSATSSHPTVAHPLRSGRRRRLSEAVTCSVASRVARSMRNQYGRKLQAASCTAQ